MLHYELRAVLLESVAALALAALGLGEGEQIAQMAMSELFEDKLLEKAPAPTDRVAPVGYRTALAYSIDPIALEEQAVDIDWGKAALVDSKAPMEKSERMDNTVPVGEPDQSGGTELAEDREPIENRKSPEGRLLVVRTAPVEHIEPGVESVAMLPGHQGSYPPGKKMEHSPAAGARAGVDQRAAPASEH